jgi:hypothetical protein
MKTNNADKPVGATLNWSGKPTLAFSDGSILFGNADRILYPEYYPNGEEWAINPETGEKMPIFEVRKVEVKRNAIIDFIRRIT